VEKINPSTDKVLGLKIEDSALDIAKHALMDGKEVIVAVNKLDKLNTHHIPSEFLKEIHTKLPELPMDRIVGIACTDDRYQHTIQFLLHSLTGIFSKMTSVDPDSPELLSASGKDIWVETIGASSRQRVLVEECNAHLEEFLQGLDVEDMNDGDVEECVDIVLKAEILRHAANCLTRVMGKGEGASTVEEVLGVVFEKFCIGK